MKKSWSPIVLIIALMVSWQYFVIRPARLKQDELLAKQRAAAAPSPLTAGQTASSNGSTVATTATNSSPKFPVREQEALGQALVLKVDAKRDIRIFPDSAIGAAEFRDYQEREKKESHPIVLLPQAFRWTSTDADIQKCLSQLSSKEHGDTGAVFNAKTDQGECTVDYRLDESRRGVVKAELNLKGFAKSDGTLDFEGYDRVGTGPSTDHNFITYRLEDSKKSKREKDILGEKQTLIGKTDWLVWGDRYFATALLPKGRYNPNLVYGGVTVPNSADQATQFGFQYPFKKEAETKVELEVFFGTRDPESLSKANPALIDAVDLGIFAMIARVMLLALSAINTVFHNYGVSIIVLTLIVRLAFWPLNKKVFESGRKMKALQPKIESLKAKYGGDKSRQQQMNVELMQLYKANKVNPLGSCLPLVFQMPIFFSLYGALTHSLDLYQAPFFGWIHDLSSRDPYFIFPALWTISLVANMRLNPPQTQPGQPDMKWMFIGMNIFFGFLSKNWPAGLTLYLLVSNLVGIAQQVLMQRANKKLQPLQEGA